MVTDNDQIMNVESLYEKLPGSASVPRRLKTLILLPLYREWTSLMELNDSPRILSSVICDTGEAVIRGQIIYLKNKFIKKRRKRN